MLPHPDRRQYYRLIEQAYLPCRALAYMVDTVSDSRYLMRSGGQLTGGNQRGNPIHVSDNYRLIGGDYGTYWRNDGNSLYLLMTNAKNQYGAYNGLRPLAVNVKNGDVALGHNASVSGKLKVGQAAYSADGNILGRRWGNK